MKRPTLHTCRRTVQIVTALAFIIIPWLNHLRISVVHGNFLAFHLHQIPLADPLAVAQVTLKNNYWSRDLLIGGGIALFIALLLGTVFCSWLCPFGLLSEWGHAIDRRRSNQLPLNGFPLKIGLFTLGLVGFFLFATTPILNQLSLPAWYSRIFQFWFEQGHFSLAFFVLVAVVILEICVGRRLWCRYICPQSVLIILAKLLNPQRLRVTFHPAVCICQSKGVNPCARACTLALNPKELDRFRETECTNCGDCVVACRPRGRALTFRRRKS